MPWDNRPGGDRVLSACPNTEGALSTKAAIRATAGGKCEAGNLEPSRSLGTETSFISAMPGLFVSGRTHASASRSGLGLASNARRTIHRCASFGKQPACIDTLIGCAVNDAFDPGWGSVGSLWSARGLVHLAQHGEGRALPAHLAAVANGCAAARSQKQEGDTSLDRMTSSTMCLTSRGLMLYTGTARVRNRAQRRILSLCGHGSRT
jgi:hypothetical protein